MKRQRNELERSSTTHKVLSGAVICLLALASTGYAEARSNLQRCRSRLSPTQYERLQREERECRGQGGKFSVSRDCSYQCNKGTNRCSYTPLKGSNKTGYECQGVVEILVPDSDDLNWTSVEEVEQAESSPAPTRSRISEKEMPTKGVQGAHLKRDAGNTLATVGRLQAEKKAKKDKARTTKEKRNE